MQHRWFFSLPSPLAPSPIVFFFVIGSTFLQIDLSLYKPAMQARFIACDRLVSGNNQLVRVQRFFWSFLGMSTPLAGIKQWQAQKNSTQLSDFLPYSWAVWSLSQFSLFLQAKLGEHVALWFALTPPTLKWLMEQENPKSLQSLHNAQHNTKKI